MGDMGCREPRGCGWEDRDAAVSMVCAPVPAASTSAPSDSTPASCATLHPQADEARHPSLAEAARAPLWWLAVVVVGLYQLGIMLLNTAIYPQFTATFSLAKDIGSVFAATLALALYAVSTRRPALFAPRRALVIAGVTLTAGAPLMGVALLLDSPALLVGAVCVRGVGSTWAGVLVCLLLVRLAERHGLRATLAALCAGWALSYLLELSASLLPLGAQSLLFWASALIVLGLVFRASAPLVERTITAPPIVELQVTNPRSFLSLSSALFVTLVLLKMSFGFAMTFSSVNDTPQATVLACVPALLAAVALTCLPGGVRLTAFYRATMLCVLAGFLLVNPLVSQLGGLPSLANVVLRAGGDLTRMLVFLLVAALGMRNPVGALPVALFVSGANSLGSVAGAQLGIAANAVLASDEGLFALLLAGVVFAFVAYNVLAPAVFDLDETVRGVEEVVVVEPQVAASVDVLAQASAVVAAERGLTPREAQALELLAHGRNTQAIMERMVVSRSTAKTHVRNVYAKLEVHSQQELIDIVEAAAER